MRLCILSSLAVLLFLASTMYGQEATTPPKSGTPAKDSGDIGVYGREVYVPEPTVRAEPEHGAMSFSDGFLRNTPKHVGVSLSVSQSYSPRGFGVFIPSVSSGNEALSSTTITPELYTNFQSKRFTFHVTYGINYNHYNGAYSELSRASQNGTSSISYTLAHRKTTLRLSDDAVSLYYDPGSLLGASLAGPFQAGSPQVYLDQRRETRNIAAAALTYSATRRGSITATLTDDMLRYSGADLQRVNALTASLGAAYQIRKWVSLNIQYSHYLNDVNPNFRNNNIEDLQIAGLSFKPKRGWVVTGSGGVQSTKYAGTRFMTGSALASVSKTSARTSIALNYNRGYSTVFPTTQIYTTDSGTINFVQSFSHRTSLHLNASSIRGAGITGGNGISSAYGTAGFDVAILNNLVVSTNYSMVSQTIGYTSFSGASLHRSAVTTGLHYFWPSPGRR